MSKVKLSENHLRSVSSSFFLIEELINELEVVLENGNDNVMTDFVEDIPVEKRKAYKAVLEALRVEIEQLVKKYDLNRQEIVESRVVTSRKSKMWEILANSQPKRLKGFGEFPPEYKEEFEKDLNALTKLVEKL